jgi:predicted Zn-dependent protease
VILTRLNRLDDAIRDLETAARSGPSPTTYYHLARAYRKAGKTEEFRSTRDRALKSGLVADQLQPNERAELKQLLD